MAFFEAVNRQLQFFLQNRVVRPVFRFGGAGGCELCG